MTLVVVLLAILAAYQVGVALLVQIGALRARRAEGVRHGGARPTASLLVPCRDEEDNLPGLLASLEPQLPALENVVFVDDRSADQTGALLDDFAARHPDVIDVVHISDAPPANNPKLEAMKAGLGSIRGDVLLMTDADCRIPPEWVERTVDAYRDPRVGLSMGPIVAADDGRLVASYSISEHVYRFIGAAGLAGIGVPGGGYGNNMAVRMVTLRQVGGLDALAESVTEDAALVDLVRDTSGMKIVAFVTAATKVETTPAPSWLAMVRQLLRWQVGAEQSYDLMSRVGMTLLNLGYLMALVGSAAATIDPRLLVAPLGTVVGATIMYVGGGLHLGVRWRYWLLLPLHLLIMVVLNAVTGVIALVNPRLNWKGTIVSSGRRPLGRKRGGRPPSGT